LDLADQKADLQFGLTEHDINPQLTDPPSASEPGIDTFLDPHCVWVNSSQKNDPRLWVFLPSAAAKPADFKLIAREVARLGYHVINLMYPNRDTIVKICNPLPDRENCYEDIRLQTLDGASPPRPQYPGQTTQVNLANSVNNRLDKLLQYLAVNYPDEGWKDFEKQGAPEWSRITIAGHSQGGGNAALIGKLHHVARVVMISSPPDGCVDTACLPARWVANGATPSSHYYGLAHQKENSLLRAERANWSALGLDAFGAPVTPEISAPPYGCTHMLLTNVTPTGTLPRYHYATAADFATPLLNGTPELAAAWRYLAGAEDC
jgi:hypothetical protein